MPKRQKIVMVPMQMDPYGGMSEEKKAKAKKFFKDFGRGFVKGFTGTMNVGLPIIQKVVGLGGEDEVEKPKKKLTTYNEFVKDHYAEVKHLPNKERFSELAKMWKASK